MPVPWSQGGIERGVKGRVEYSLMTKLAVECVGNGAVADVDLEGTKGHHSGWLTIAMGYGFGVMFLVLMFGGYPEPTSTRP